MTLSQPTDTLGPDDDNSYLVLVECSFLMPTVRDSDRTSHALVLWELMIAELFRLFGGGQGPRYRLFVNPELLPGGWVPGEGQAPVLDECREYRVTVNEERLDELRSFLRGIAAAFDQQEIYLSVRGVVESVRPEERS